MLQAIYSASLFEGWLFGHHLLLAYLLLESRHSTEKLSAELASVNGDIGKSNFTTDSI